MSLLNYSDIAIFISVAEQNSFTAAADKIGLPKSTVSRRVSRLEDTLKIRLIERTSRKIALTIAGKTLFTENKELFGQINKNLFLLAENRNDMSGIIRLTAPNLIADTLLNKMLIDFQAVHPNIEFYLHTSDEIQDLVTDEFDLALRIGPLTNSDYICQKLWSPELIICATPTYVSQNNLDTPQDLMQNNHLLNNYANETCVFRHRETDIVTKVSILGKQYSNNKAYTLQATLAHKGASAMPKYYIQKLLDDGELIHILRQFALVFPAELFAVYPSKRHLSQKIDKLITYLKQEFSVVG